MESGSPQQRPRSNSKFSLKSHKSDKSDGKKPKMDLHETDKERRKSKFTTKSTVNPNKAMDEAQPGTSLTFAFSISTFPSNLFKLRAFD